MQQYHDLAGWIAFVEVVHPQRLPAVRHLEVVGLEVVTAQVAEPVVGGSEELHACLPGTARCVAQACT